jgi:hypothetical protein
MGNFAKSFEESFKTGAAIGSNAALETMKEKIKQDALKADKATTLANIKAIAVQKREQASKMGFDPKTLKYLDDGLAVLDTTTDPEVAQKQLTSMGGLAEDLIKSKTSYERGLQTEGVKARMLGVNDVLKTLTEKGGLSLDEIQQIGDLAYQRASQPMGEKINNNVNTSPMVNSINNVETSPAIPEKVNKLFSEPLQPKKSDKQLDREEQMKRGMSLINLAESNYNTIQQKYGTGRIKGMATTIQGKLGDILDKKNQAPEVAPYLGNLDGLAQFVGRNVYNDDRVSNEDRKAYRKSLAELTNTPEEAKIMFNTLRSFTESGDVKAGEAIKLMVPRDGSKPLSPSKALKYVDSGKAAEEEANSFLSTIRK